MICTDFPHPLQKLESDGPGLGSSGEGRLRFNEETRLSNALGPVDGPGCGSGPVDGPGCGSVSDNLGPGLGSMSPH